MLIDGKTTFNIGYDRCYCHVVYIHNVAGRCYLPMDMMAKKCLCDRCYGHIIIGWYFDHVTDGTPHVWQLIIR